MGLSRDEDNKKYIQNFLFMNCQNVLSTYYLQTILDFVIDDVVEDIDETADESFNSDDIVIAFTRVLVKKMNIKI